MKIKILFTALLLSIFFSTFSYSQQNDSDSINTSSIITKSSNDSGVYIKYVDVYLREQKLIRMFETLDVSVRIFLREVNGYYFMLNNFNTDDIVLIEYSKLVKINNALLSLSANLDNDIATQPDYLENKYLVGDIAIGYYVRKGYTVNSRNFGWFIDTPSGSRLFFNQANPNKISFQEMLKMIQSKIEELQKIYDK